MPLMDAVPGFADVRRMSPPEGRAPPLLARTWMPLMVSVSTFAVPPTESVTVMVVLVTAIEAAVMSFFEANETLPAPGLKFQPLGAVRMRVWLLPVAKSPLLLLLSAMTMLPRVVYCGDVALAALSAETLAPPLAPVTATLSVNVQWATAPEVSPRAVSSSVAPAQSCPTYQLVWKLPSAWPSRSLAAPSTTSQGASPGLGFPSACST